MHFFRTTKGKVTFALAVSLVFLAAFAVARANREKVDLVNGINPRWDVHQRADYTFAQLRKMPPSEHQKYLEKTWPTLKNDITAMLASKGRLPGNAAPDSIVFHFGSSTNAKADDADGVIHNGYFEGELVAFVYPKGGAEPMKVLVQCLNGLYYIEGDDTNLERLWSAVPNTEFTISKARGLTTYVDYATSIMLAERFSLPLYRGRDHKPITPAEARAINTDRVPVMVLVFEGDKFDLAQMTYTPAPRHAQRK